METSEYCFSFLWLGMCMWDKLRVLLYDEVNQQKSICNFTRSVYLWIVPNLKATFVLLFFNWQNLNLMLATVYNVYINLGAQVLEDRTPPTPPPPDIDPRAYPDLLNRAPLYIKINLVYFNLYIVGYDFFYKTFILGNLTDWRYRLDNKYVIKR